MGYSVLQSYLHQQRHWKNGWYGSGITKVIKENICKKGPFENQIIFDLYLYGHDLKKTSFDSSLIFVKVYQLIFVKLSFSFANNIFLD